MSYALQLCSAISHLAEATKQIIHCDIKPANIFVGGLTCVLADFGLARISARVEAAEFGPSLHTYRSPDIAANLSHGDELTSKSDVFLLGLTLAELFTGKNPCRPALNGSDPVELETLDEIPGIVGNRIHRAISSMLYERPNERPTAALMIDVWQGILFDAVEHIREVDPNVF